MAAPSGDFIQHDIQHYFTKAVTFDAAVTFATAPLLSLATAVELTLDTNGDAAKTAGKSHFTIDTFEDAASDTLRKLTGGAAGDVIFLHPAADARTVIIEHDASTADEFRCPGGQSITLAEDTDYAMCVHDGTGWIVLAYGTLAADIDSGRIVAGAVDAAHLAADVIDGTKIADNAVDSEHIVAGAVDYAHLAADITKYIPVEVADPGTGAAIPVTGSATIGITTAGAETNTLAIPTFIGQKLIIYVDTYVGDRVVTVASPVNVANNNTLTFGAESEAIELVAVKVGGTLAWQVGWNDGVGLTTV